MSEHREREREVEALVERQPFGEELRSGERRGHLRLTANVEDLPDRIAAVEPAGRDVARQKARETTPAAAEVDEPRLGQLATKVLLVALPELGVEGHALPRERDAARAVVQRLERRVRH